jgi:hypothetical protein
MLRLYGTPICSLTEVAESVSEPAAEPSLHHKHDCVPDGGRKKPHPVCVLHVRTLVLARACPHLRPRQ